MRSAIAAALLALAVAGPAPVHTAAAQTAPAPAPDAPAGPAAISAGLFVQRLEEANEFELESGRLAAEKAASAEVKQFAQQMIADHGRLAERLKAITSSAEYQAPNAPTKPSDKRAELQKRLDELGALDATEFDRAYVTGQIELYGYLVGLVRDYAERGTGDALVGLARDLVAEFERHQEALKRVPLPA